MENLVKEHVTLHKVLSRFLSPATVDFIMLQVVVALNQRLVEEFGNIGIRSEEARERLRKDAMYLKTRLGELKGLEKGSPGEVSWAIYFYRRRLTLGSTGTGGTHCSETVATSCPSAYSSSDTVFRTSLIRSDSIDSSSVSQSTSRIDLKSRSLRPVHRSSDSRTTADSLANRHATDTRPNARSGSGDACLAATDDSNSTAAYTPIDPFTAFPSNRSSLYVPSINTTVYSSVDCQSHRAHSGRTAEAEIDG